MAQLSFPAQEAVVNPFFAGNYSENSGPFFSQYQMPAQETPDLKIIQDSFVYGVTTTRILSAQTLGSTFGDVNSADDHSHGGKEPFEYTVASGDSIQSIAKHFNVSVDTILWANKLSKNTALKVGQTLTILPVSGVVHVVKSGDTITNLAKKYKAKTEDIIAFNELSNEGDIFIGDILVIAGGVMPVISAPIVVQAPLANSFFITPTEGKISQRLHFYNAIDIANKCGTPIYAAASGVVQRAKHGWNYGGGNVVTILHSNGVVSYYGHLMSILVKPGETVEVGQKIGLMGGGKGMEGAGISTGCHLHFDVTGAKNPLAGIGLGAIVSFK